MAEIRTGHVPHILQSPIPVLICLAYIPQGRI